MASNRAFRVRHAFVSCERLSGDVIAVNLTSGTYFSLAGVAGDIWTAFTSGAPEDMCAKALEAAYGVRLPRDEVDALLEECISYGLIEVASPWIESVELPDDCQRPEWSTPVLEVFDDLQDLILVDPIHDTSDLGWPATAVLDD